MANLKVGIIGTGFVGAAHVEALRRLNNVEVRAVVASSLESSKKAAEKLEVPNYYADYQEMLAEEELDVIHNCTPNNLHFPVNKAFLEAGVHVFSEKPLVMNSEKAEELLKIIESSQIYAGVNYNYRHYPLVKEMQNKVKEEVGKFFHVRGYYLQDWMLFDTDYSWRIDPEKGGKSRVVADIGSHFCDLLQYLTGKKITRLIANTKIVHPERKKPLSEIKSFAQSDQEVEYETYEVETEDYASILFELEDGTAGNFTVSQVDAGHKNDLFVEISGSKKSLSWSQENANQLFIGYRDQANQNLVRDPALLDGKAAERCYYPGGHIEGWSEGLKNSIKDFYECLEASGDPADYDFATFAEGAVEVKITEAILKSSKEEKWVEIYK
ncbi:putative dehydrogenase [Halanaerobium saccharolyticum]|uniref:Putative dehydrogenase n=1 Tax=Halanaerobium saccharolyticum TaxID=43595 RepID=A0A4R7Z516_9FIRM|nr:Gfo/Idh/MocA family oxidoreductase [Halanaerobium saccharolyticum]RAK08180.1 putative dehydrogenase [Halanaerobium saccharolyticum]TDW04387.1 putative dehydrogenase [Halanaerobium saccharolyticum]TDX59678.1 putative dehydrogenase [Halanaerobium saccharolyticum]